MRGWIPFLVAVVWSLTSACGSSGDGGSGASPLPPPSAAASSPAVTASPSSSESPSPSTGEEEDADEPLASPVFTRSCTEEEADDQTDEDPWVITVENDEFHPSCLVARVSASVEIPNNDDHGHTFRINGTLVFAPLIPGQTYTNGSSEGFIDLGVNRFHCTIHPEMTGTLILV